MFQACIIHLYCNPGEIFAANSLRHYIFCELLSLECSLYYIPKLLISTGHNFCWLWLQGWGFWLKFWDMPRIRARQSTPPTSNSRYAYLHPFIFTSLTTPYAPFAISRPVSSTSWSCSSRKLIRRSAIFEKTIVKRAPLWGVYRGSNIVVHCACAKRAPAFYRKWVGQTRLY